MSEQCPKCEYRFDVAMKCPQCQHAYESEIVRLAREVCTFYYNGSCDDYGIYKRIEALAAQLGIQEP